MLNTALPLRSEDNFLPKEATNPEAVFQIEMAANVDGDSFWHANPGSEHVLGFVGAGCDDITEQTR